MSTGVMTRWGLVGPRVPAYCFQSCLYRQRPILQSQLRTAATSNKPRKKDDKSTTPNRKRRNTFIIPDLKDVIEFPLLDAMRYIRAAEVGRSPTCSKYELHVRLKTLKSGAVVRNRLRLPHPVRTDMRLAVICPPNSLAATAATRAGAVLVGEDNIFDAVKQGRVEFDRCICHQDSVDKLNKAGLGRILGPKGLMPSAKLGTVVKDVAASVKSMVGASEYRERLGVVRMAIGQLGYTPDELQRNIKAFIDAIKKDCAALSETISKEVHEIILSSTNGPGLTLSGQIRGPNSLATKDLAT